MKKKTFTLDNIQDLRRSGLYFLYKDDVLVYIGVSKNIYVRVLEHCFDGKKDFDSIKTLASEDNVSHTSTEIMEIFLISSLKPKYNKLIIEDTFIYYNTLPSAFKHSDGNDYESALSLSRNFIKHVANKGYEK